MGQSNKGGGTVTIANSGTTSTAIDTAEYVAIGIILPAAFTGSAITFSVSQDNTTYGTLYTAANAAQSITVTQARAYPMPDDALKFRYVKLISGSSEEGARTIVWSGRTV